jgi:hypothetical protein
MVSTILQRPKGSSRRERVRWIERVYATQIDHKASRLVGEGSGNGGLMADVGGE